MSRSHKPCKTKGEEKGKQVTQALQNRGRGKSGWLGIAQALLCKEKQREKEVTQALQNIGEKKAAGCALHASHRLCFASKRSVKKRSSACCMHHTHIQTTHTPHTHTCTHTHAHTHMHTHTHTHTHTHAHTHTHTLTMVTNSSSVILLRFSSARNDSRACICFLRTKA